MHMWFWFGTDLSPFLLSGYNVTTTWGLIATCLGLTALAIIYEAMKAVQIKLHQMNQAATAASGASASENSSLLYHLVPVDLTDKAILSINCGTLTRFVVWVFYPLFVACQILLQCVDKLSIHQTLSRWLIEVFHYAIHVTLGYMLMLAAMTYNGYICLALVAGTAIGYHIFGPTLLALNINQVRRRYQEAPCESECVGGNIETSEGTSQQSTMSVVAEQGVSEVIAEEEINAEVHPQNESYNVGE